jgi:hypothetical protein
MHLSGIFLCSTDLSHIHNYNNLFLVYVMNVGLTVNIYISNLLQAAKIEPRDMLKRKGESTEGIARCTFEDRILMSDVVFLRAWVNVDVPTYCNLVTTALQPREQTWQGMRTTAELRRAHNIPIPHNKDSVYKVVSFYLFYHSIILFFFRLMFYLHYAAH